MWPGTRTQKLPQRTHPRMAVKGATQSILPESDVGIIPRIIPSIEGSDHTLSNTKISDARPSVREVLEKVSRHELSIRKAHRTIARLWKSSHMQILGSDDPGSLAGTSRFKDQGVQTEPRRSLHALQDPIAKIDWSINSKSTDDSGYLSRSGPIDSRNEDPSSDLEPEIDQGFGQRHLPPAITNTENTYAGTHRLQAWGHGSNINVKQLSPSRIDDENQSRSSRSSSENFSNSSKEQDIDSTPCTHPTVGTESPSDESTPASSDNSEATLTKAILANCATEQIASDVTRNFMEIVRSKFGLRQRGPTSSQEQRQSSAHASRPSQDIRREAPQRGRQRLSNDRKRSRQSNGEDEDSDRAPNDKTPESKRRKIAEAGKPKIACPFMKHSPTEFSDVSKWRTCIGPGFDGMNRMKYVRWTRCFDRTSLIQADVREHLKRRHFKDCTCQRCGVQFSSNDTLQDHLRALEPCKLAHAQHEKGLLTSVQWAHIQAKRGRRSLEERWKEIYLIIFPKAQGESIPSPCKKPSR